MSSATWLATSWTSEVRIPAVIGFHSSPTTDHLWEPSMLTSDGNSCSMKVAITSIYCRDQGDVWCLGIREIYHLHYFQTCVKKIAPLIFHASLLMVFTHDNTTFKADTEL
jgi:hypothetical protein